MDGAHALVDWFAQKLEILKNFNAVVETYVKPDRRFPDTQEPQEARDASYLDGIFDFSTDAVTNLSADGSGRASSLHRTLISIDAKIPPMALRFSIL